MKHVIIILWLVIGWFCSLPGQDIIVRNNGDTLNCKITKVKKEHVHFTFKYEGEVRNSLLPKSQIKYYEKNYFEHSELEGENVESEDNYTKVKFGLYGGYSYQTAKISEQVPEDMKDYIKGLRNGGHFGIDFAYYFSENVGVGLIYNNFSTKNKANNVTAINPANGKEQTGRMEDDILIQFFGPSLNTSFSNTNKKFKFNSNFGIGYVSYKNDAVVISEMMLEGSTVGVVWEAEFDYLLTDNFAMGLDFGYLNGTISEFDVYTSNRSGSIQLPDDQKESIARLDAALGIKVYL